MTTAAERRRSSGRRRAALRPGPLDGVRRRGLVALEDAACLSTDRSYEFFWRQAARWLSSAAPDPVTLTVPDAPSRGDAIPFDVDARDAAFAPVAGRDGRRDAARRRAASPAAHAAARRPPRSGRFTAAVAAEQPGSIASTRKRTAATTSLGDGRSLVLCRRRRSRVCRSAAERRFPAPRGARVRRALRPRGRGVAASLAAQVGGAAERRARAPRSVARAVGVRARDRAAVCRMDSCGGAGDCDDRPVSTHSGLPRRAENATATRDFVYLVSRGSSHPMLARSCSALAVTALPASATRS